MPYLTPDELPTTEFVCRRLVIPDNIDILIAVNGALNELCSPDNWEAFGSVTSQEIADAMQVMIDAYLDSDHTCP